MKYELNLREYTAKNIYDLGENFSGERVNGEEISFTNYFMKKNHKPFYGISGEFHFSRCEEERWEDELIKMKMCHINIISTYVIWNHHEEVEGSFDFTGRRNLRKFIELCQKHGLFVILRIGPFAHGEVRNGGLPDWLYGKPFEVRNTNEGFMQCARKWYEKVGQETRDMYYGEGGPIIAVQLDNEYMHSSAPWEMTTGITNEWASVGTQGNVYMLALRKMAKECGILPAFYTCTGWGGAATPDCMMPLWGGYAYRPWLFYARKGEHPSTEEYLYRDFHNNSHTKVNDFEPKYEPETRPYACCEMGGGMFSSYNYRFQLPYKSVDAMANIKMASGCNFLGYYVFQGGNNPVAHNGTFLNESQVPKISYDYQAAIGEFGQIRESYLRLKTIHLFAEMVQNSLCEMRTILPEDANDSEPKDLNTMRYSVRTNGKGGFLFINNFQDHEEMPAHTKEEIVLHLPEEEVVFDSLSIAGGENCILPFHMDLNGIELTKATAQPVTKMNINGRWTYLFMEPEGMKARFTFANGSRLEGKNMYRISQGDVQIDILCLSREMINKLYVWKNHGFIFSDAAVMIDEIDGEDRIRLETTHMENTIYTYPTALLWDDTDEIDKNSKMVSSNTKLRYCKDMFSTECDELGVYQICAADKQVDAELTQVGPSRYDLHFPENMMDGVKDLLLKISYAGDVGNAFINGRMIHDNFCNGAPWEIGLKGFAEELEKEDMCIYITPLKEGVNVNVESTMAGRVEEVERYIGEIRKVEVEPVYEVVLHS